ncbi:hypothetical protein MHBO_004213 [Bonamia ostreae]|uniref:Uncharacterized protein n=1 Tax=Bonamia ostreae TaxID=126728 RepID=A0ABV2ASP2_9EUKA
MTSSVVSSLGSELTPFSSVAVHRILFPLSGFWTLFIINTLLPDPVTTNRGSVIAAPSTVHVNVTGRPVVGTDVDAAVQVRLCCLWLIRFPCKLITGSVGGPNSQIKYLHYESTTFS